MRILHLTDGYRPRLGGIEVLVEDLAHRQAALGHDVTVLAGTPGTPAAGPVRVLRASAHGRALAVPTGRRLLEEGEYDVVHAHVSVLSPFSTLVARTASGAGLPVVMTVHSLWGGRTALVRAVRAVAGWDHAPVTWTAVSSVAAAEVRRILRPSTPVRVVPNAVDVDWWRADARPAERGAPMTVVAVQRMAARKRPLALVRILERLRRDLSPETGLRAVLVGDGPLEHRVRDEVRAAGLDDWVWMPGRLSREEIRHVFGEADVFVAPAYQESFGIAALEARSAGLPVVAMASGGVGEFVRDGIEGFLCADDRTVATRLADLARAPELRTAMAAHNRAHPPAMDWPAVLDAFERVYGEAQQVRVVPGGLRRQRVARWPVGSDVQLRPRRAPVDP